MDYKTAREGESSSRLVSRGSSLDFEFWGTVTQRKLKTYIPLHMEKPLSRESGPILAVFEITQDISEDYAAITRFQNVIMISLVAVMSVVFFVLRFIVKRAEQIIARRAEERRRLEEQLHQAERMVALGKMVAGISHEIRNPLGIIGSTAQLMYQKMDDDDPRKQLGKIIMEETSRLNGVVREFLDFARPVAPNLSECRVDEVLERNLAFLDVELQRRGIRVEKAFALNGRPVQADPDLLYRAFLNILVNAMESVEEGGAIRVATSATNCHQDFVEVRITDTGKGIPGDILQKIFDPFFTTRETGTGLGLPIVRNIIESHGGTVSVESPPRTPEWSSVGGGTAIIICLPVNPGGD
jgi:signal transduction histidine kinase